LWYTPTVTGVRDWRATYRKSEKEEADRHPEARHADGMQRTVLKYILDDRGNGAQQEDCSKETQKRSDGACEHTEYHTHSLYQGPRTKLA